MSNFVQQAAERFDNKTPLGVFYNFAICGPLAQLVEQRPFKAWVVGSSPTRLTMCPHRLARPRTSPFQGGNAGSNPAGDAKEIRGLQQCSPFLFPQRDKFVTESPP